MAHAHLNDDPLDGLNDQARRALYDRLALEFNASATKRRADFTPTERDIWQAIVEASQGGSVSTERLQNLVRAGNPSRRKLAAAVEEFEAYLDSATANQLTGTQRPHMRRIVIRALVAGMRNWTDEKGKPFLIVPSVVLNSLDRAPAAVEAQFPGYARARLLHKALLPIAA